jgi:hypothetical protein
MVGSLFYQGPTFTSDKERLRASLGLLPPDEGSPVWVALDRAVSALSRESNRRVIVIYTDGRDADHGHFKALKVSDATVRARLEASVIMVYVVGFEGITLGTSVKTMARRSGGRVTELGTSDDLGAALGDVAAELHHQYLLGFKPAAFDGSTHTLEVRINRPDLTVRARQQYVAVK